MCGGKFLGMKFPEKILNWGNLTEFLDEIILICLTFYLPAQFCAVEIWKCSWEIFGKIFDRDEIFLEDFFVGGFFVEEICNGGIFRETISAWDNFLRKQLPNGGVTSWKTFHKILP